MNILYLLRSFKNSILRVKEIVLVARCFYKDYVYYIKTSYKYNTKSKDALATPIMLTMHQLEKGISMKKSPRTFGGDKTVRLIQLLNEYKYKYGIDNIYILATNILYEYRKDQWHDISIENMLDSFLEKNKKILKDGYAGVKNVTIPDSFNEEEIINFFKTRHSCRDYSEIVVTKYEIEQAENFAKVTPTACNRQANRVHFFNDKEIIKSLIDNQLGAQGWCNNATGLIVITSNQTFFGGTYERYEALIDGGLYAMNFVWGLHLQRIGTCFKMFVREPDREKRFKEIAGIPHSEIPVVLILCGHYKNCSVSEPKSVRI